MIIDEKKQVFILIIMLGTSILLFGVYMELFIAPSLRDTYHRKIETLEKNSVTIRKDVKIDVSKVVYIDDFSVFLSMMKDNNITTVYQETIVGVQVFEFPNKDLTILWRHNIYSSWVEEK